MKYHPSDLPLLGRTVIVTRAESQQGEAQRLLKLLGANVIALPALVITPPSTWEPLDQALEVWEKFDWIIFSSANGVRSVAKRLEIIGRNILKRPENLKIAAVGSKTAEVLKDLGALVDFVPPDFVAESLLEHFPDSGSDSKLLIPRVESGGRKVLSETFMQKGFQVVEVPAYESCCPKSLPKIAFRAILERKVDAIAFTSGKTALHTAKLLNQEFGSDWLKIIDSVKLVSIGPQTTLVCKKYFFRLDNEATPHDLEGLIQACINVL